MRTQRLAELAGVNPQTLRYYERIGLLPQPPRSTAGYRDYPDGSVRLLRFVRRAKELGFQLGEPEVYAWVRLVGVCEFGGHDRVEVEACAFSQPDHLREAGVGEGHNGVALSQSRDPLARVGPRRQAVPRVD